MVVNKSVEALYYDYAERKGMSVPQKLSADRDMYSEKVEAKLEDGNLTIGDLADYEEAVQHMAFYAGFYAAMEIFRGGTSNS